MKDGAGNWGTTRFRLRRRQPTTSAAPPLRLPLRPPLRLRRRPPRRPRARVRHPISRPPSTVTARSSLSWSASTSERRRHAALSRVPRWQRHRLADHGTLICRCAADRRHLRLQGARNRCGRQPGRLQQHDQRPGRLIRIQVGGPDTTPPSTPSNLTGTPMTNLRVQLSWDASTDDRPGTMQLRAVPLQDAHCQAHLDIVRGQRFRRPRRYNYRVKAVDEAGNRSWYTPRIYVDVVASSGLGTADTTPPSVPDASGDDVPRPAPRPARLAAEHRRPVDDHRLQGLPR